MQLQSNLPGAQGTATMRVLAERPYRSKMTVTASTIAGLARGDTLGTRASTFYWFDTAANTAVIRVYLKGAVPNDPVGALLAQTQQALAQMSAMVTGMQSVNGHTDIVVQLAPKPGTSFGQVLPAQTTVTAYVDSTNGAIDQVVVDDGDGHTAALTVISAAGNVTIPASAFAWTPPKDARVVTITGPTGKFMYGCPASDGSCGMLPGMQ